MSVAVISAMQVIVSDVLGSQMDSCKYLESSVHDVNKCWVVIR